MNDIEMLDRLALISFVFQMYGLDMLERQATNDEVIEELHKDIHRIEQKLDQLLEAVSHKVLI